MDANKLKLAELRTKYQFYKKIEKKLEKVMNAELEIEDWQEEVYSKIALMEIEIEDLKIEMDIPDSEYSDLERD